MLKSILKTLIVVQIIILSNYTATSSCVKSVSYWIWLPEGGSTCEMADWCEAIFVIECCFNCNSGLDDTDYYLFNSLCFFYTDCGTSSSYNLCPGDCDSVTDTKCVDYGELIDSDLFRTLQCDQDGNACS